MALLEPWLARAEIAGAIAMIALGAMMAWSARNLAKRLVGMGVAYAGAALALAAMGAPEAALIAGLAVSLGALLLGAALLVRLQEAYGSVETDDFDAADADSEPPERAG